MATEVVDMMRSESSDVRWAGVFGLCEAVSRYFHEQARPDLTSDAALHVYDKVAKGMPPERPGASLKAYYETIAFNRMRRQAKHWRKQGQSLDASLC